MLTKYKHIVIDETNYHALKDLGKTGDSFNDVLRNIILEVNKRRTKMRGENK